VYCCRTKQELSVPEISNPRDLQRSNADKSVNYDNVASGGSSLQRLDEESSDYGEESGKNTAVDKDDKNKETGSEAGRRLSRDANAALDKYTDQDERSSLYDDYEAKDIAKRGILGGPEDYEEENDDSSSNASMEDMAAIEEQQESSDNEATASGKRAVRGEARVKRDRSVVSDSPDKLESSSNDPSKSKQKMDNCPQLRQVSGGIGSSRDLNEASSSTDASNKLVKGSNELDLSPLSSSDAAKMDEETNVQAVPSKRSESTSDAEYEKRVEEEIQRKIDSIKEEIQRDIETQRRINDIEENNARFDELQDQQEREEQQKQNSEMEPVEKRQTLSKRSIRGNDNDGLVVPSKSSSEQKKRSSKGDQYVARELQRRSGEIGKSDKSSSKERSSSSSSSRRDEDAKKRAASVVGHDDAPAGTPSKRCYKKKRDRIRQTVLANDEQQQQHGRTRKRHSRSYDASSLDRMAVKPENELFDAARDSNSYLRTDDRMVRR